ncbi:MAG: DNA recombination protein RmuC [Pseudomonadota bacterium]
MPHSLLQLFDLTTWALIALMVSVFAMLSILMWLVTRTQRNVLHTRHDALRTKYQTLAVQEQAQSTLIQSLQSDHEHARQELSQLRDNALDLSAEYARSQEQLKHLSEQAVQQEAFKQQQQKELENQFTLLAHKIFDEKTQQVEQYQNANLQSSLKPFKEQLGSFQKRVEELYDKEMRDRLSLSSEIGHLKKLNLQMSDDAVRLTEALRGKNKIQGNWGEMILEQVLEDSGLRKGHEYDVQVSLKNEDGQRLMPDVIVHLPNQKDIVIDSKVSLLSYERFVSATSDEEREVACKQHVASLRKHLNDLNSKAYERLEGVRTLDFVFLFVPIEGAFLLALEYDTELFRLAFNKQVVLVSPTTLFACLRTVEHLWRYERQNQHAETIAKEAANLHDKLVGFSESLLAIGASLDKATMMHQKAVSQFSMGKGNIVNRVQKMSTLGAPTKKKFAQALINNRIESYDGEQDQDAQAPSDHTLD